MNILLARKSIFISGFNANGYHESAYVAFVFFAGFLYPVRVGIWFFSWHHSSPFAGSSIGTISDV